MEMEVAAMSMAMANSNLQNSLSVSMLKKSMEAVEDTMEGFIEMMNNIPSPDGRGQLLNVRV
ncbi:MAG: YjfB family protein [Oscillospiraceae bacterium]|nr:YjfB family protein [Oscillospiraceae bacterium]